MTEPEVEIAELEITVRYADGTSGTLRTLGHVRNLNIDATRAKPVERSWREPLIFSTKMIHYTLAADLIADDETGQIFTLTTNRRVVP